MNDHPTTDDSPLPTPPAPRRDGFATEGETFQHYQVLRRPDGSLWELGRGAMGVTYKAFDTNLRCHVALKVISADYIHSETAGQRFVREARVAARLRHPNVASVYHLGVDPQGFFYSMEFIDGETLEDLVARVGPLPVETVLHVALQVARALGAAAKQGLIHRDIKPANVMVIHQDDEGDDRLLVKMIDFGLARSYSTEDSAPQLTSTGFVGTPLYASPEQLEEQDLDIRSDIYSLGVTMWILLVGRPPFEGKMTQVITQHLHAPPPWWQLPALPDPVRALLEKTLHKNRLQRYQSAGELRQAIENCLRAVSSREDLLLPPLAEGTDPGETARIAPAFPPAGTPLTGPRLPSAQTASTTDTVAGHLGAAARTLVQSATARRWLGWPLAAAAGAVLLVLVLGGLMFGRSSNRRTGPEATSRPAAERPADPASEPSTERPAGLASTSPAERSANTASTPSSERSAGADSTAASMLPVASASTAAVTPEPATAQSSTLTPTRVSPSASTQNGAPETLSSSTPPTTNPSATNLTKTDPPTTNPSATNPPTTNPSTTNATPPSARATAAVPTPSAAPTPEPDLLVPEPSPVGSIPPPLVAAPPAAASGLEAVDGSPTSPAPAAATESPSPSQQASETPDASPEAKSSPTPQSKGSSSKSKSTRRRSKPAPTPTPNFFQKLFGIKPKPTPKKSR